MPIKLSHHLCSLTASMPLVLMLYSVEASAKADAMPTGILNLNDPFYLLFLLIGLALLPFIAVMTTSFAKIVVVLSIARQAIGTTQTPPNIVIMSIAILLTAFSMYPVGLAIYGHIDRQTLESKSSAEAISYLVDAAKEPVRHFLTEHALKEDIELFYRILAKSDKEEVKTIDSSDFIILAPAFLLSELSLAFQIGFLVYLPFLVIDMTVANLLMALGMQMLAPTTISLPFKILLFVLVDGWRLLCQGLAGG